MAGSLDGGELELVASHTLFDEALRYRSFGFSVLPLWGKKPAGKLIAFTHGSSSTRLLAERGANQDQLRFWFSQPDVNVGIFCGEPSRGLVVVDVDCECAPAGAYLPRTPTVSTARGAHYYYLGVGAINQQRPWGEVRAEAPLYVAAPPSIHPATRRPYRWLHPLGEFQLAEFSEVHLPPKAASLDNRTSHPKKNNNPTRSTKDHFPTGDDRTSDELSESWLKGYDRDPNAVRAMARALGINTRLGSSFRCVLHDEANPSAALHRAEGTKEWLYHDFHAPALGEPKWLNLAQVRARLAGRRLPVSGTELATWKLILLVEAGLLKLAPVPAAPPASGLSPDARHVYERFLFLLGCRWLYSPGAPAPLARGFAAALTGLSEIRARRSISELDERGQIYVVGRQGRLRLWLPAGVEPEAGMQ